MDAIAKVLTLALEGWLTGSVRTPGAGQRLPPSALHGELSSEQATIWELGSDWSGRRMKPQGNGPQRLWASISFSDDRGAAATKCTRPP